MKNNIEKKKNRRQLQIFYWRVKLKRKINLTKVKKKNNKKNKDQIEKKIIYHKLCLNGEIKNKLNFTKESRTKIKN